MKDTIEAVERTWQGLDILVNNAGIAHYGPTEKMTDRQLRRLLAVNLYAPVQLTRGLLPLLLQRPEAHILNVCSVAGLVAGPKLAAYHASKFGLVGFSESLRAEFGPRGVGVTAICPGLVRTNIFQSTSTSGKSLPKIPYWLSTSPEKVASRAIRAIRRNEGLVVITPLAHFLCMFKRRRRGSWIGCSGSAPTVAAWRPSSPCCRRGPRTPASKTAPLWRKQRSVLSRAKIGNILLGNAHPKHWDPDNEQPELVCLNGPAM